MAIQVFLNALAIWQFGKHLYVMVRRLSNRFIGESSGYFRCLCVVYLFLNAFVHQNMKDFINKYSKIYRFIWQQLTILLWQVGNTDRWHLEKKTRMIQRLSGTFQHSVMNLSFCII